MSVILEPPAADASPDLIDRLKVAAGPGGWIEDPAALANRLTDWRGLYRGRVRLALQPGSTAAVADIVRLCAAAGVSIVPQGGNTGMVGGATPSPSGDSVLLSLGRLDRIRQSQRGPAAPRNRQRPPKPPFADREEADSAVFLSHTGSAALR